MAVPRHLPPPDLDLSPLTGWTREHWLATADALLAGAQRHVSPGYARITPPGPVSWSGPDSDALEGFARTFLLLAVRTAGEQGTDPAGLLARYASGLSHGVDLEHPEAWPRITASCPQAVPEACSLVVGLQLTRAWLWDLLPTRTQQQVVDWLDGVFALKLPDNNWHLFRILVAAFLEAVGGDRGLADAGDDIARIEDFWVGHGWFRDGMGDRFDHYGSWAMHTLSGFVDVVMGRPDVFPESRPRLRRFLEDYAGLFGADGAPLHQGRSLIYRTAAAAAPWLGALTDATPLSPGQTRRLASRTMRHFCDHGFLNDAGVPSLGWYDAFPPMVQPYSAPASPYWIAKGFLGLLLPADHPVWTAREQELQIDVGSTVRTLEAPGWIVSATHPDGIVRVANHGSDNYPPLSGVSDPHYARLAYSTATGPLLGSDLLDNHVGLVGPAGDLSLRGKIERIGVRGRFAASWHEPMWPDGTRSGATIRTISVSHDVWEIRCHVVEDAPAGTELFESGWQVAGDDARGGVDDSGTATAQTGELVSVLAPLHGHGTPEVVRTSHTSAYGATSTTPVVRSPLAGRRHVAVSLVGLHGAGVPALDASCRVVDGVAEVTVGRSTVLLAVDETHPPAALPEGAIAAATIDGAEMEYFRPTTRSHGARVTRRELADGREIIYFDDPGTHVPAERPDDTRELPPRPETATMRQDVLTGDWISPTRPRARAG